jgi:hypothetical protein
MLRGATASSSLIRQPQDRNARIFSVWPARSSRDASSSLAHYGRSDEIANHVEDSSGLTHSAASDILKFSAIRLRHPARHFPAYRKVHTA